MSASKAILSGVGVLVAATLSGGYGLALAHANPHSEPWRPAIITPAPVNPPNMTASQIAAWDVYRVETGDGAGGCWADFTSSFRGWSKDGKTGLSKDEDLIAADGEKDSSYVVLDPYQPGICGEDVKG